MPDAQAILYVDDDVMIRELAASGLEESFLCDCDGYEPWAWT
jgi:hypothetical protein